MYVLFIAIALAIGAGLIIQGRRRESRRRTVAGALVLAATGALFALMSFWGEMLWFEELGHSGRFWTAVLAKTGVLVAGAAAAGLGVLLLTQPMSGRMGRRRRLPVIAAAVAGGVWGLVSWDVVLRFIHRVDSGTREPILGLDAGFYLFTLPLLDQLFWLALFVVLLSGATVVVGLAAVPAGTDWDAGGPRGLRLAYRRPPAPAAAGAPGDAGTPERTGSIARPAFLVLGALALVLAAGVYVSIYHLLFSRWSVVVGPGWTDVHVRLPAHYMLAALLGVAGAALLVAAASPRAAALFGGTPTRFRRSILVPAAGLATLWIVGLYFVPLLFQWLRVGPNEITVERPYLAHNIEFTRRGFDLEKVEERAFAPSGRLTPEVIAANEHLLSEVRLWDPQALQAVYGQFQEIRLYYEMADVDIDRYVLGGRYRQVMVAAREIEQDSLPAQSKTFVNERFKYTHGHGVAMASVRDFTPDGLPNLLVKDIPPVTDHPELRIDRPEIYYGERTREYVVVNTKEAELDYPSGENNVYARYAGAGGVQLESFWRKLVFGWKLGGTRLLFSSYPTPESRILFRREVQERVSTLAPFLDFDRDPYIVLAGGRLQWIIDGYTTSGHYPYSDPYFEGDPAQATKGGEARPAVASVASFLHGKNYVRNSVKAVVDAYDGKVTFYVFEPGDPIIQVWGRIYPGLFRPKADMPPELVAHVRYPEGFLLAQGLVHAKYHMTDPAVFYNQEDLWIRATERYYDEVRPVEPYYVMWQPPGEARAELALIQPYTPKNRQVLVGWIAGLCDGDNYGRLIAYRFPKDKWVLGTQQVDTKIDQDRFLSAQLALWDQRGSRVIRGNVLVIPVGETLLYVEPVYLQAQAAAYPELRVVVLMHEDKMSYGDTFDAALRGLVEGKGPAAAGLGALAGEGAPEAARRASEALSGYLRLMGERRFEEAGAELRALEGALREMEGAVGGGLPGLPRE